MRRAIATFVVLVGVVGAILLLDPSLRPAWLNDWLRPTEMSSERWLPSAGW